MRSIRSLVLAIGVVAINTSSLFWFPSRVVSSQATRGLHCPSFYLPLSLLESHLRVSLSVHSFSGHSSHARCRRSVCRAGKAAAARFVRPLSPTCVAKGADGVDLALHGIIYTLLHFFSFIRICFFSHRWASKVVIMPPRSIWDW